MSGGAIRQAVILAGGKGTRLGAITRAVPKPMLPIAGGRPFVDYLLEMIERHGYRDIVLLAGHLGEALEAAYGGRRRVDGRARSSRSTLSPHERRRVFRHQFARPGRGLAKVRRHGDPGAADGC